MTITEFLLARIAEDEAVAHQVESELRRAIKRGDYLSGHEPDLDSLDSALYCIDGEMDMPAIDTPFRRVLAECAAKRAIVEALVGTDPRHEALSALTLEFVVGQLAAIYADHPDYDTEWAR